MHVECHAFHNIFGESDTFLALKFEIIVCVVSGKKIFIIYKMAGLKPKWINPLPCHFKANFIQLYVPNNIIVIL